MTLPSRKDARDERAYSYPAEILHQARVSQLSVPEPDMPHLLAVVDGQKINIPTLESGVDNAMTRLRSGRGFSFFTLNLDHLVKLREGGAFRSAYAQATFVSADGAPVVRLARRQGAELVRTTGADLVLPLCAAAQEQGVSIHLFGSSQDSLEAASLELKRRFPRLHIAACESPPMGFDPASPEAEAAARRIALSGAKICFLALGAPKQEIFAAHAAQKHPGVGFVCIGAALDFISGRQVRAPAFMQKTGLEWFWRFANHPRRLGLRYARCALVYADLALLAPVRRRLSALGLLSRR